MNSITFSVKAENDAHVLLSGEVARNVRGNQYIEVVLGGWSNGGSIIRVGNQNWKERIATPNILDAGSYRDFWVSWDQHVVKVGRGLAVGQQMFLEESYPSTLNVKHLGIWNGYGSGGAWMINT